MGSPITPAAAQMALAIAIIRSKPVNTCVRDYMTSLRKQIRQGDLDLHLQEQTQYIDLVAYWQQQCQRLQEDCDHLRASNVEFERLNRQLSQRAKAKSIPAGSDRPIKRKASCTTDVRAPKRAKNVSTMPIAISAVETEDGIGEDLDVLETLGKDGSKLVETLFATHDCLRSPLAEPPVICSFLVQTSRALSTVLPVIAKKHEQLSRQGRKSSHKASLHQDKSDFALALAVCARAFTSVLVGLKRLRQRDEEGRFSSLIICELANMFKQSLMAIETSSHQIARATLSQRTRTRGPRTTRLAINGPKESRPARAIAHFLIGLFGFLDRADEIHRLIFDAFVFVLFERVARRLYYCTFTRNNTANLEECLALQQQPKSEEINEDDLVVHTIAIRLEVKALILVLERAMGLAPSHMNHPGKTPSTSTSKATRTMSYRNIPSISRAPLSSLAKDRLQRTLIKCMYGDDSNDEFLDVLTKPLPAMRLGSLPDVTQIDDNDVENWYSQEVWRLVGWDVLAKDGVW